MTDEEIIEGLIQQTENATELFQALHKMIEENKKAIRQIISWLESIQRRIDKL